jgi:predicted ATPase/class 3 adenylate cyclase
VEPPPPDEQRKQVTILFATIDGFTRLTDAPHKTDRLRQIDLLWRQLDETIRQHGGIVDKHMGDVIMGIFGAPVAHENDPERAVRCALAMRDLVGDFSMPADSAVAAPSGESSRPIIRIGINTGQASLGPVGSDDWLTAIGDAVNVASRLKEALVEAGIYISQETNYLVHNLFRSEPLGDFVVKGRRTPIVVYRVLDSRPRVFFSGAEGVEGVYVPMIGRDGEMDVLQSALRRTAQTGQGAIITIVGEAGVGKSRLVREFHNRLESFPLKAMIFQARSDQRLTQVPYSFIRELLFNRFGISDRDSLRATEEKILKGLHFSPVDGQVAQDAITRESARNVGRLMGLEFPGIRLAGSAAREAALGRDQAHDDILEYFNAAARRSAVTLLFLEDIHWADEESLALLESIAASSARVPLLMICMARPLLYERLPGWPGEGATSAKRLVLPPLSETDSRELVSSILRKLPQIPPALTDLIVRSAAGNPFYVEELVRVLIEDGVIVPDESSWHLQARELTRLRVPATLTGVLQARLDRLPEMERITLQQAAVIGDEFWDSAVYQLNRASRNPLAEEQVTAALLSLERRDMIYRAPTAVFTDSRAFLFKHSVLREVAYEGVLLRDRPGYHLEAARWLEGQSGSRATEYAAPIAHHHELAGRPVEAARRYELAAARAVEQYKLSSAIDYYRKILNLLKNWPKELDTRLGVKWRLGRLLQQQGRLVEALDVYRTMRHSAELDGNLVGQARAENATAAVYLEQGEAEGALAAASRAEALARLAGDEMELTWALLRRSQAAGRMGRLAEAIDAASRALEHSGSSVAPQETARGLALLAAWQAAAGQTDGLLVAKADLASLADELEKSGSKDEAAFALVQLGGFYLSVERLDEAREYLERALELQRATGDRGGVAETLRLLGLVACRKGCAAEAVGHLEEAETLAEATGNRYIRLVCRLAMAEALLTLDQFAAAEATLRQVIAAAEDRRNLGRWVELPHAYDLLIQVLNRQGRQDEARLFVGRGRLRGS